MPLWFAVAVWVVEVLLIAALSASRRGAKAAVVLAVALLPIAGFLAPRSTLASFALAIALLLCVFRAWDLASGSPLPGFGRRLLHLIAIVDTRKLARAEKRFEPRALRRLGVALVVVVAGLWLIAAADAYSDWRHYALRWYAGGVALVFAAFELIDALIVLATRPAGLVVPPINQAPWRATSIAEFWSRRWNSVIGTILREHVYRPFRRRGAIAGLVAAFVFSAAFHAYLIGLALGPMYAASWIAFFLLQPALIAIERGLGVRRWRPAWARAWTLAALGLLVPLFIEPALVLLERL